MSIDAIAVVNVSYITMCKLHDLVPSAAAAGSSHDTYPFAAIGSDGTACFLGVSFGSEPDDLAAYARHITGPGLDRHNDGRGVLVIPSVAWGKKPYTSYQSVVDEVGEAGQWVSKMTKAQAEELLSERMHALDAEGSGDIPGMPGMAGMPGMPGMPDLAGMASMLGGGGLPGMPGGLDLNALTSQLGGLLAANPGLAAAAEQAMGKAAPAAMAGAPASAGGNAGAGGADMFEAAKAMLANMSPEQRAQIEQMATGLFAQMGGSKDGGDGGKNKP